MGSNSPSARKHRALRFLAHLEQYKRLGPLIGPKEAHQPDYRWPVRHWLLVFDEWDEDGGGLEIVHDARCPTVQAFSGVDQYDCEVAAQEYSCGIDMFFLHRDDPDDWYRAERVNPGAYQIEAWYETYNGPEFTEHESGLRFTMTPDDQPVTIKA